MSVEDRTPGQSLLTDEVYERNHEESILLHCASWSTGSVVGALALKTFGDPSSLLPGADQQSKQAVLTSLSIVPPSRNRRSPDPRRRRRRQTGAGRRRASTPSARPSGVRRTGSPFGDDPIFRRFFGVPAPSSGGGGATRGAGSGVIISPDGYVLTNNHVVDETPVKVTVNVGDKESYDARVVGTDPMTDIAVVKINTGGTSSPPPQLGNSDDLRVGDWAIAVGNPLDVGTTVTLGIISAVEPHGGLAAEGHPLNSVHPDRRRHQPRQLRRRAGRHQRARGRHQRGDLLPDRLLRRHRLRHPDQLPPARSPRN